MLQSPTTTIKPRFCGACGATVPPDFLTCPKPACRSTDVRTDEISPPYPTVIPVPVDPPWDFVGSWPEGASGTLTGPPGCGKSSIALRLADVFPESRLLWLTAEQEPGEAAASAARCLGGLARFPVRLRPVFRPCKGPADVAEALRVHSDIDCVVALDSLSRCPEGDWPGQLAILATIVAWAKERPGRRALAILQVNGTGEAAGMRGIPHLVDFTCDIGDADGTGIVTATKNRNGPLDSRYFELGSNGVTIPEFPFSYSVEGNRGTGYRLHDYPTPGAKWAGLLDAMRDAHGGVTLPGYACAARPVPGYPDGVLQPRDVADRKRFAERHGLTFLSTLADIEDHHA